MAYQTGDESNSGAWVKYNPEASRHGGSHRGSNAKNPRWNCPFDGVLGGEVPSTGSKFDRKCKHARSAMDLAEMRVREDTMHNHPEVATKLGALEEKFKRKFRSNRGSSSKKARTS
jgi:hypothetical protein